MTKYQEKQISALNRAHLIEILNNENVSFREDMSNAELRELILSIEETDEGSLEPDPKIEETDEGSLEPDPKIEEDSDKNSSKSNLGIKDIISKRSDNIAFNSRPKNLSAISFEISARKTKSGSSIVNTSSIKEAIRKRNKQY